MGGAIKRKFKWLFVAFLSSFSPAMYVTGDAIDAEGVLSITTEDIEDWIQAYNHNLTWPNNYKSENSGAFLAKPIGSTNNPKGVVLNRGTQYLKNRQLGIQIVGKTHRNRWRSRRDTGSDVSPYEVVLTSVAEDGTTIKHERLGELSQNIHVIEWEGSGEGSKPDNFSENENYRGIIAVSFLKDEDLKSFVAQFDEYDSINVQDVDIRDILKKTVKLDYDLGNMKVTDTSSSGNTFMVSSPWYKTSSSFGHISSSGKADQEKIFAQEILNSTDWMKRSWYKGEDLNNETTDESWNKKEVEIQVPEKYYVQSSSGYKQVEFSEDQIKGIVKLNKESDGSFVIGKRSTENKITVGKNDLSATYWINRRNRNVVRRVIKELLIKEGLEDLQLEEKEYSYSDLEKIVKKKFILDKFKELDPKCGGNLIDTDDWITFNLESFDSDDEEEEGGEEDVSGEPEGGVEEDLFAEEKFCDKWKYPKVKGIEDPNLLLAENVWEELKKEVEQKLDKLRKILKDEMNTHLNSGTKEELRIPYEKVEQIQQICGKNLESCQIKPKTTKVTEYKKKSETSKPEKGKSLKDQLISLPDKFGIVKDWNHDKKFVNPLGSLNDKLVPIVWTIQGFSEGKGQKPWSKSWSSNYDKEQEKSNKKQIKVTKIKEWR